MCWAVFIENDGLERLHLAGKGIPSRKNSKQRQESRAHRRKEGEAVLFGCVGGVALMLVGRGGTDKKLMGQTG